MYAEPATVLHSLGTDVVLCCVVVSFPWHEAQTAGPNCRQNNYNILDVVVYLWP